ncbi:hypothetical protein [Methylobacterium trifolii]|uniref:hypothetical protein n=1 Tax=Methylobacterium trifolii TaxID=1003092 RepID=UPI001EDDF97A|nr:hypothetical protein [Methylobacterium trifolii]
MSLWDDSECETFYADGRASATEACVVRISDGRIVVDANGANGGWMYEGEEVGPDHFSLTSLTHDGKAKLHRCAGDEALDGSWREGGVYGMWRITLGRSEA